MAAEEPHFAAAMILRELRNARDAGHGRLAEDQLQQQIGAGRDDLVAGLRRLVAEGRIENVAPGQWSLRVDDHGEEVGPEPAAASPERGAHLVEAAVAGRHALAAAAPGADATEVRLTRAMVEGMDPGALGQLILSGVQGSGGQFVLVVVA